jgi:YD repeat-containing protein
MSAARRPTTLNHFKTGVGEPFRAYSYAYDREGHKWYEKRLHGDPSADVYNYDGIYRLTDVKYSVTSGIGNDWNNKHEIPDPPGFDGLDGTREVNYLLDDVGNREMVIDNAVETDYVPNEVNEYEYVGPVEDPEHYLYDRNGNLLWDGSKRMSYDYANRLVVVLLLGGEEYRYRFDALGRRVKEEVFSHGEPISRTYFAYDNYAKGPLIIGEGWWEWIPEGGGPGKPQEPYWAPSLEYVYVRGALDEVLARYAYDEQNHTLSRLYYHPNQLGSTMALTDPLGNLIETYEYDVFGMPDITQDGATNNRFLFEGYGWDAGIGLYNYSDVAYNPFIARLLQTGLFYGPTSADSVPVIAGRFDMADECSPEGAKRVTKVEGRILGTGLDPDTVKELKDISLAADILSLLTKSITLPFVGDAYIEVMNRAVGSTGGWNLYTRITWQQCERHNWLYIVFIVGYLDWVDYTSGWRKCMEGGIGHGLKLDGNDIGFSGEFQDADHAKESLPDATKAHLKELGLQE